jgi:hypothetical protein
MRMAAVYAASLVVFQGGITAEGKGTALRGAGCAHCQRSAQLTQRQSGAYGGWWLGLGYARGLQHAIPHSEFRIRPAHRFLATKLCSGEQARTVRAYLRI